MSKKKLDSYLNSTELSEQQKNLFNKMYPNGTSDLKGAKLDWAITQCENTLKTNSLKAIEIKSLFSNLTQEDQVEVLQEMPNLLTSIFDSTVEEKYYQVLKNLANQRLELQKNLVKAGEKASRDLLPKTPKANQRPDLKAFDSIEEAHSEYLDEGLELFDCGQGFYQDEAINFSYVEDTLYKVKLTASIDSKKQDRGDRLFWVDKIKKVEFIPCSEEDLTLMLKNRLSNEISKLENSLELKKKKIESL